MRPTLESFAKMLGNGLVRALRKKRDHGPRRKSDHNQIESRLMSNDFISHRTLINIILTKLIFTNNESLFTAFQCLVTLSANFEDLCGVHFSSFTASTKLIIDFHTLPPETQPFSFVHNSSTS